MDDRRDPEEAPEGPAAPDATASAGPGPAEASAPSYRGVATVPEPPEDLGALWGDGGPRPRRPAVVPAAEAGTGDLPPGPAHGAHGTAGPSGPRDPTDPPGPRDPPGPTGGGPSFPPPRRADAGAILDEVVRRLRHRALAVHGAAAAAAFVAAAVVVLVAAGTGLALGAGDLLRDAALLALAVLGAAAVGWVLLHLARARGSDLARALEARDPRARGLATAVELLALLRNAPADPPFSVELARAHVATAARQARAIDPARAFDLRPLRRAGVAAGAAVAVAGTLALLVAPVRAGLGLFLRAAPDDVAAAATAEPITGEIELTYVYPAHTGLPTRTVPGTNGEIGAPRGTEVTLRTRADRDLEQAFLVLDGTAALPLSVDGQRLEGALVVGRTGSYAFRFEDDRGRLLALGPPIPIVVAEDAVPEIRIVAPEEELVVTENDAVELGWEASDDYGLGGVELVFQVAGGEERTVPVTRFGEPLRRADGAHRWELAPLALKPGDVITYYLRVTDNDAVSGPKRGQSRTGRLEVFSEAEHRRKLLARVEAAWEAMVAALGDRIAPRLGPRKVEGEARVAAGKPADAAVQAVTETFATLAAELGDDEKAPRELALATANVLRTLAEKARATRNARAQAEARSPVLPQVLLALDGAEAVEQRELEKDVLYLEALLDRQRLEEMRALAQEMAEGRQELAKAIESYRQAPSDEARRAIAEEVGRLRERLADLMRKMAELGRGIQDAHLNREALAEVAKERDLLGGLDRVQELLAQGNVEEALKELEQLGEKLDGMEQALAEAQDSQAENDPALKELAEELGKFEQELGEVREAQRQVAQETEAVKRELRREVEKKLAEEGESLVDELRRKVERARLVLADLPQDVVPPRLVEHLDGARERLENLDAALAMKDFDAALESAALALGHARGLEAELGTEADFRRRYDAPEAGKLDGARAQASRATRLTDEVKRTLEQAMPDPSQGMTAEQRQRMKGLEKRQAALEHRMGELQRRANRIGEQAPIFDPAAQGAMQGAERSMNEARGHLAGKNPGPALAAERRAEEQLRSLQEGLEQLKQQAGKNSGGAGFPLPLAMGGTPGREDGEGGRHDPRRKVVIPGADQYRVPEEYRKDILEAMKQGAPEGFEDHVREYYEEIVK